MGELGPNGAKAFIFDLKTFSSCCMPLPLHVLQLHLSGCRIYLNFLIWLLGSSLILGGIGLFLEAFEESFRMKVFRMKLSEESFVNRQGVDFFVSGETERETGANRVFLRACSSGSHKSPEAPRGSIVMT